MRVFRACVLADFDCPCKFYPPPYLNNEHLKNYFCKLSYEEKEPRGIKKGGHNRSNAF